MPIADLNTPPDLSAREQRIAALAESLANELAPGAAVHDRSGSFPLAHYQRLHEAGYLRLAIPLDYSGDGATLFEMVLAQERLAQADAATAVGVGMLLNVIGPKSEPAPGAPVWPGPVFGQVGGHPQAGTRRWAGARQGDCDALTPQLRRHGHA
jgi:hypothetical protein